MLGARWDQDHVDASKRDRHATRLGWMVAGLLVAHGLIHVLGFVWTWGLAEVPGLGVWC